MRTVDGSGGDALEAALREGVEVRSLWLALGPVAGAKHALLHEPCIDSSSSTLLVQNVEVIPRTQFHLGVRSDSS